MSIVVPCFNEEQAVVETASALLEAMRSSGRPFELVFVDDGSTDGTVNRLQESGLEVGIVRNDCNMGYGASIKRGADETSHPLIAITDADGTYPNERLAELCDAIEGYEMAVGARTGSNVHVPLVRRPAKWALGKLANYLSGTRIPDLNSGLRVMRRRSFERCRRMLPDGFSLTTTITLALLCGGHRVKFVPIDYHKRKGSSSIRPIRDTLNFLQLIVRAVMWFQPLKVLLPVGLGFIAASAAVLAAGILWLEQVPDISTIVLFVTGVQVIVLGLVADLVDKRIG